MLILSAEVGEGHAAAARALKQQLEDCGEPVEVEIIDGLAAMGERLRAAVADGYRTQLRVSPRSYSFYYWMLEHLAPVRFVTKQVLCRLGARSLRQTIARHDPDVVVSTYPAITVVLSHLRRRRQLDLPTVATITDMTGLFFWAQRGIDTHLVMYDASVRDVERIAGRGSVQVVRPLIAAEFLEPRDRGAARAALGLPHAGRVIVVSGGGWGVGDLEGAVEQLLAIPDATVIAVAGRNECARTQLCERFAAAAQVRVIGFTDQMSDLLAAADVLVHSTGGVTCLEAMARGCPVVSYGLPVGHAKLNTRLMAKHEFLLLAEDSSELVAHVERGCANRGRPAAVARGASLDAASAVLAAHRRVNPIAAWRIRAVSVALAAIMSLGAGAWVMSTDEVAAFASVLGIPQVRTIKTTSPAVALLVRAPTAALPAVIHRLEHDGLEASIVTATPLAPATLRTLTANGDFPIPAIRHSSGLFSWIRTSSQLRREARALHLHHHFFYLEPHDPSLGQLLLARAAGGQPVTGSVSLSAASELPQRRLRAGDVVVVTLSGRPASLRVLDRLESALQSDRLFGLPLSLLAG